MRAQQQGMKPEPFTVPLFGRLAAEWQDWERGIPPTREWRGRGALNPHWLAAMAVLGRAASGAKAPPKEDSKSFAARVRAEVG